MSAYFVVELNPAAMEPYRAAVGATIEQLWRPLPRPGRRDRTDRGWAGTDIVILKFADNAPSSAGTIDGVPENPPRPARQLDQTRVHCRGCRVVTAGAGNPLPKQAWNELLYNGGRSEWSYRLTQRLRTPCINAWTYCPWSVGSDTIGNILLRACSRGPVGPLDANQRRDRSKACQRRADAVVQSGAYSQKNRGGRMS